MTSKRPESSSTSAAANSLTVLDKNGKNVEYGKVIIELAALEGAGSGVTTVANVDTLRKREPAFPSEFVVVMEYTPGSAYGGGVFVHDVSDTTSKEDYGITLVTPKGARWKRAINDYNDVNVVAFGAVPGGKLDCKDAVTHMWNWAQANYPHIGIKFPAGTFLISSFDISAKEVNRFRLVGEHVNSGYYPATTLISDKKNGQVMFSVNARYMVISGLEIDGQSTDSAPNTKGFYKNVIEAGQYVRVTSVNFLNLGGRGLDMLDTLDCKIDLWYAKKCTDTVIYATWSDNPSGKWDHITAIELSNFNIQYCTKKPAIDLQRAGQSVIWNGWIEHTEFPGNIANGQWTLNALSIEDCQNALACHYSRIINIQFNQQGTVGLDFTETGESWDLVSEFERGDVRIENHGVNINGSLNYQYLTSPDYMDNRTGNERWFYLGEFFIKLETAQLHIHLVGTAFYSSVTATQTDFTDKTAEGCADIYLQKKDAKSYIGSWVGQGSVPVKRVLLQPGSSDGKVKMFVRLEKFTGYCIALLDTNDYDRFNAGDHFRFYKGYRTATSDEVKVLDAAADNCFHQHWLGRDKVGLGFNNDDELLIRGKTDVVGNFGTATRCLKVMINGQAFGIDIKPLT
ncbi:hypothetical protein [Erwinia sp. 9145]|uniref:hypothetical protein n=1 Tax=Erwinia sp. 9145 TaxID=1500895 RepID=UPI00068E253D|nr:hypothetical protein [Erwinia sp. 9145]